MMDFMEEDGFATWPQVYVLLVSFIGFLISLVYILLTPNKGSDLTEEEERALHVKHLPVFGANLIAGGAAPERRRQPASRDISAPAPAPAAEPAAQEQAPVEAVVEEAEETALPKPKEEVEVVEVAAKVEEAAEEPAEAAPKKGKKKKAKAPPAQEPAPAPAPAVEEPAAAPAAKEPSPLQKSLQNEIRKHQKKLREVSEFKARQEGGEQLSEGQLAKVANEPELLRLISEAQAALEKAKEDEAGEELKEKQRQEEAEDAEYEIVEQHDVKEAAAEVVEEQEEQEEGEEEESDACTDRDEVEDFVVEGDGISRVGKFAGVLAALGGCGAAAAMLAAADVAGLLPAAGG